jgi:hypothetical protein
VVIGQALLLGSPLGQQGIDWTAWITAVATSLLAGGVLVAIVGLWDARKTRHGQLVTDLSRRWDEPLTAESMILYSIHGHAGIVDLLERLYADDPEISQLYSKLGIYQKDLELYYELQRWPSLIEAIGVLRNQRAISTEVVFKMWGPAIASAWVAWRDPVEKLRQLRYGDPSAFRYFEALAALMTAEAAKEAVAKAKRDGKETVAKARSDAKQAVAEAKRSAEETVAKAKRDAKQAVAEAKRKAEEAKKAAGKG